MIIIKYYLIAATRMVPDPKHLKIRRFSLGFKGSGYPHLDEVLIVY